MSKPQWKQDEDRYNEAMYIPAPYQPAWEAEYINLAVRTYQEAQATYVAGATPFTFTALVGAYSYLKDAQAHYQAYRAAQYAEEARHQAICGY